MSGDLTGKVVFVTGGTQGLGAAVATLFAERGAKGVIITGRNRDKGADMEARLRDAGTDARFVAADLGQLEDCRAAMAETRDRFGTVDILVNAAGNTKRGTIVDTTPERFDAIFAVNIKAPFFLTQDAVRMMIETGTQGSVVNILSTVIHCGQPFISAYSASKAALANFTRNTAFALLRNRIRVNGLAIGWMNTPGEDAIQKAFHGASEGWLDQAAANQPFGRLLDPAEVARAVAFLAGPESGMMTGALVDFDQTVLGGWEVQPAPSQALTVD